MLASNFNVGDKFTYGDYGLITIIDMQGSKWFKSEDGHIFAYIKEDNLISYKFEYTIWNKDYSFELYHEETFSKEQLTEIQKKILKQILKQQELTEEIVEEIKKILIEEYDFIKINYNNIMYIDMDTLSSDNISFEKDD